MPAKALGIVELSRLIGVENVLLVLLAVLISARLNLRVNAGSFYVSFERIYVTSS